MSISKICDRKKIEINLNRIFGMVVKAKKKNKKSKIRKMYIVLNISLILYSIHLIYFYISI
jgi:hypothetical protein